ncbi:RagB/SusD family nutrient uptake outer membrane protein [Mariniphaga sediminis]|uniref:RagB/SusD family nutrient uptake outer membrane protein n=1 Tax=Mariniphaga sediminis TaxID=1628158 RepID=A0A399CTM1_9BACT|nr:RagB/SusD family nutrient uptake outer membrane protein [Mariniphaga sediminis]RIH63109.1 RagB/SusD family nutrient uptake outer membrane protein [Mariniphaga sediminis]
MKKIIWLFILIVFAFGCNETDFLNETPVSYINSMNFYNTSDEFEQAINSAYTSLQPLHGGRGVGANESGWAFGELRSDNTTFQYNESNRAAMAFEQLDEFTMDSGNGIIASAWDNSYIGISKCNTVLSYIENTEVENKERYIAEAKFLRAYYYFHLVRHFGDVPLITDVIKGYNQAFELNKRVSATLIYELIITDLEEAKGNLPASYDAPDAGRATAGAAKTLLAKVLMWNGRYSDAAKELKEVYTSGQYSLLDDYSSLFDINNENNEEIVFSVQYITGPHNLYHTLMYRFLPHDSGTEYLPLGQIEQTGFNIPTADLIDSFEEGDDRLSTIDFSWVTDKDPVYQNSIVPFTKKYMDNGHTIRTQTGNNVKIFRYPHVLLMLAECYLREGGGDPLPLVNAVRLRAKLQPLSSVSLDDIIHERRVEFHCELDRWDVLVRTGKAVEVMTAHGNQQRERKFVGENSYKKIKLLFPIPDKALDLDPTMEQNPEYK